MVAQQLLAQSAATLQSWPHEKLVPCALSPAHVVPVQHLGESGPQAAPTLPQPQNEASTQKPNELLEKGSQQPVSQSLFVWQSGLQPAHAGLSVLIQSPLQQLLRA